MEENYQKFLHNYLKPNPGYIIDVATGEIIGKHEGLMNYTIGQRRNVGISGHKDKHYVVGKNVKENILYVAFGDDPIYLYSDSCTIKNINFISEKRPEHCTAKFRYRSTDIEVEIIYKSTDELIINYKNKTTGVTPGQACVLYDKDECLGSGIIEHVFIEGERLWYL